MPREIRHASRALPEDVKAIRPEVPWPQIKAIGNGGRHEYHGLSGKIFWGVIVDEIARLRGAIDILCVSRTGPNLSRDVMLLAAIGGSFRSLVHAVVADDMADAQPIVREDTVAAGVLGGAMCLQVSPCPYCLFIAPEGQREQLAAVGKAFEALDRDEAVDLFQFTPKLAGEIEIGVAFAHEGQNFEDYSDHGITSFA